jgi:PEGA domain
VCAWLLEYESALVLWRERSTSRPEPFFFAFDDAKMNDFPRQRLCEAIAKYGEGLCDQPRRLEGLLRDLCGAYRLEINLVVNALREGVATELQIAPASVPSKLVIARLSKRLQDHLAVNERAARWAVESWALALGKISRSELGSIPITPPKLEVVAPPRETEILPLIPTTDVTRLEAQSHLSTPSTQGSGQQRVAVIILITLGIAGVSVWLLGTSQSEEKNLTISSPPPGSSAVPASLLTLSSTPAASTSTTLHSPSLAATAPPSSEGALWISTDPAGATAIIDSFTTRTTPATLSKISAGRHHLRITLDGYEPEEREIEIKSGQVAMTGTITLRARISQFDGEWTGRAGGYPWTMILTIHGQTASATFKTSEKMPAKADHWNNVPAPYNKVRTISHQWTAKSKSVTITSGQIRVYWDEWKGQGSIPSSVLRKIHSRPPPGQFNDVYPPEQVWGFIMQESKLVSGLWSLQRKG